MKLNWLWAMPERLTWEEAMPWLEQSLAADPEAAAIDELEAEQFAAACFLIPSLERKIFHQLKIALSVRVPSDKEQDFRRAVLLMLRQWRLRTVRGQLVDMLPSSVLGSFSDPKMSPELWTTECFQAAYLSEINICLLAQYKRHLNPTVDIHEWLATLAQSAPRDYAFWTGVGRLTLRRVLYPAADRKDVTGQAAPSLMPEAETGRLRQQVRRLEQDQKRLKAYARRREQQRKQALSQGAGELEAARRRLSERNRERPQELAEQAKRYEAELTRLRQELDRTQAAFLAALRERSADLFRGQAFNIQGGDDRENRILVETLGGRLVTDTTATLLDGDGGPAAVERQLHGALLTDVQIRCDGSRRRKGQRPGIATSAFQVYTGGAVIHSAHRVICCGTAANSQMAEFAAVVMALDWLLAAGPARGSRAEIWSDCRYMVDHITGRRPLTEMRGCKTLAEKVRILLRALARRGCDVKLTWVKRDLVDACDRLCDLAYREAAWYHQPASAHHRHPLGDFLRTLTMARKGRLS